MLCYALFCSTVSCSALSCLTLHHIKSSAQQVENREKWSEQVTLYKAIYLSSLFDYVLVSGRCKMCTVYIARWWLRYFSFLCILLLLLFFHLLFVYVNIIRFFMCCCYFFLFLLSCTFFFALRIGLVRFLVYLFWVLHII